MYGMKADAIVGYTFKAETYCPACIIDALPTEEGQDFDGWGLAPGVTMTTEDNLNELAAAFGIDREDEYSFDSDYFPKVIFSVQVDSPEYCGACGRELA